MKQLNFFKITTILLLLLNLGLIGLALLRPPGGVLPPPPPHHRVERLLDFDEAQKSAYKGMRNEHQRAMRQLNDKTDHLLSEYFIQLTDGNQHTNQDSIMAEIQQANEKRITITYEHFADIKSLCSAEQAAEFPEVLHLLTNRILKNRKKMPPPRRK